MVKEEESHDVSEEKQREAETRREKRICALLCAALIRDLSLSQRD